jgi:hypothetical protein
MDEMLLEYLLLSADLSAPTSALDEASSSLFALLPEPVQHFREAVHQTAHRLPPDSLSSVLAMLRDILSRIQVRLPSHPSSPVPLFRLPLTPSTAPSSGPTDSSNGETRDLPPSLPLTLLCRVIVANDALPLLLSTGFEVREPPLAEERLVAFSREDSALLFMLLALLDTALAAMRPGASEGQSLLS